MFIICIYEFVVCWEVRSQCILCSRLLDGRLCTISDAIFNEFRQWQVARKMQNNHSPDIVDCPWSNSCGARAAVRNAQGNSVRQMAKVAAAVSMCSILGLLFCFEISLEPPVKRIWIIKWKKWNFVFQSVTITIAGNVVKFRQVNGFNKFVAHFQYSDGAIRRLCSFLCSSGKLTFTITNYNALQRTIESFSLKFSRWLGCSLALSSALSLSVCRSLCASSDR